jgi:hypothetical protein
MLSDKIFKYMKISQRVITTHLDTSMVMGNGSM